MSRWEKITLFVTLVFIGIPTAASYYPPLVTGIADQLPLDFILTWMGRIGLIALGVLSGWYLRGRIENPPGESGGNGEELDGSQDRRGGSDTTQNLGVVEDTTDGSVDSIEGCIETGETCWRGTAELEDGELEDIEIPYRVICPQCQTVMYDGEGVRAVVATTGPSYWDCPNCGHRTLDEYGKYEDAQNLLDRHIRRITESEGEEYSLDNLIDNIEGEVTPRGIWEEYAQSVDEDHVSLNCFH